MSISFACRDLADRVVAGLCTLFLRPGRLIRSAIVVKPPTLLSLHRALGRILEVDVIKTVPYVPLSHPFVERLIGTIRRECLDQTLFWTTADLEMKLRDFQRYFNGHRTHAGLGGLTPEPRTDEDSARACVRGYRWRVHCRGRYQTPIAA